MLLKSSAEVSAPDALSDCFVERSLSQKGRRPHLGE
jgi:hypothetical protein